MTSITALQIAYDNRSDERYEAAEASDSACARASDEILAALREGVHTSTRANGINYIVDADDVANDIDASLIDEAVREAERTGDDAELGRIVRAEWDRARCEVADKNAPFLVEQWQSERD